MDFFPSAAASSLALSFPQRKMFSLSGHLSFFFFRARLNSWLRRFVISPRRLASLKARCKSFLPLILSPGRFFFPFLNVRTPSPPPPSFLQRFQPLVASPISRRKAFLRREVLPPEPPHPFKQLELFPLSPLLVLF